MLKNKGDAMQYLLDYRDGKIKQGLGIGCFIDEHLKFNQSK